MLSLVSTLIFPKSVFTLYVVTMFAENLNSIWKWYIQQIS